MTLDMLRSSFHPVWVRIDYVSTINVRCDLAFTRGHGGGLTNCWICGVGASWSTTNKGPTEDLGPKTGFETAFC